MICTKCKMRPVEKHFAPICYICGLKAKGFYAKAIKVLTSPHTGEIGGWWGFKTHWDFKVGWSFAQQLWWVLIVTNVLNHPGLNKTCKAPEFTKGLRKDGWPAQLDSMDSLLLVGESIWRAKTACEFFPEFQGSTMKHRIVSK